MSVAEGQQCLYCGKTIDTAQEPSVYVRPEDDDQEECYAHFGCYADHEVETER